MKIAYFSDLFLPYINGISIHLSEISIELAKRGHTIELFVPKVGHTPLNFHYENINMHFIPSIPTFAHEFRVPLPISLNVIKTMLTIKPDIVHFHTPFLISSQGIIMAKILKKPLFATFHGYFMEAEYLKKNGLDKIKLDSNKTLINLGWMYNNLFLNRASIVISPSASTKKDLIMNNVMPPIEVISNGINLSIIKKNILADKLKKYILPAHYFLYTGRISSEKNIELLIKGFSIFSKKITHINLVIVGDGPEHNEIKALIKKYGIEKRVYWLGMINHDTLLNSNIYKDALAFVTTSKSETQCICGLEALAFGLPIIGVNARAIPDIIKTNGVLIEPDNIDQLVNAMIYIAEKTDIRQEMSAASFRLAERHSIDKSADKLEQIYKSISIK